ncbi:RAVE complex protein Rav1 C-terminal protein [Dioscorea alata]|uniref:RAVE complex protein Rav1 C-terminal protein n=1 Tax=Dioscorea alata TaxID=55571 RepID=A0ACB7VVY7_DIOAL|nr:RAVE complex protein Rav1 C-terminal protein [Dioscorea alata]
MRSLPSSRSTSQILPPAPNRRKSAVDWLPEFGSASWVSYGASSLLVISHFPNPLYEHETLVGSLLQQVIEPLPSDAGDELADVNAVRWCPTRPSVGEIAAAAGNFIRFYSPCTGDDPITRHLTTSGSFCWRQTAGIVQSFTVEAIEWTGSGDGLIATSVSVALWVRKNMSWEMAWKSSSDIPQTMVSATLFAQGPIASAASSSNCMTATGADGKKSSPMSSKERLCVSVYHRDGKSGFTKLQLFQPQPVCMIQWRPSNAAQSEKNTSCSWRDVLLTCCLDGTDVHDKKTLKRTYHVIAVIEINQHLRGAIDIDIFISWATEYGGIVCEVEGGNYCLTSETSEHNHIGKSLTFWAIHCLDDSAPLRFPRVTLWKTQELMEFKGWKIFNSDHLYLKDRPVFVNAVASRIQPSLHHFWPLEAFNAYSPPVHCSLLQLLPDNSFSWLQLYNPMSNSKEDESSSQTSMEKCLSCVSGGVLKQDGHTGKIMELDVHPCYSEMDLAVSLDCNGSLLFWSLSTASSYTLRVPAAIHPLWKILGKIILHDISSVTKYSAVRWAPLVLGENHFLLLAHADGIDCFVIQVSEKEEALLCQKILSIPFGGLGRDFQALSWKVVLHLEDPSGSNCKCDSGSEMVSDLKRNVVHFAGKQVYATAGMCSSFFPDPYDHDQVTSVVVLPPDVQALPVQNHAAFSTGSEMNSCMYTMATGCSDGMLKLWRICYGGNTTNSKSEFLPWEIVGMLNAHQGPVSAVSLSTCGGKIATSGSDGQSNNNLHIWEPVCLVGGGNFLLEDVISLTGAVIALNWITIGDGRLLLGVYMLNTLCVYSAKRFTEKDLVKSKESKDMNIWFCIAQSHVHPVCQDFSWGPKLSPVLVHEKHISLFSQWSSTAENILNEGCSVTFVCRTNKNLPFALYTEKDICIADEPIVAKSNHNDNHDVQHLKFVGKLYDFGASGLYSVLDISERLHGCLVAYHPQALMHVLYSGNWRHVLAILGHLVESIKSNEDSADTLEIGKSKYPSHKILEIQLLAYFPETILTSLSDKMLQWGQDISSSMLSFEPQRNLLQFGEFDSLTNAPNSISEKSEITGLIDILEKTRYIPGIIDIEKTQILSIVDLVGEVSGANGGSVYQSLDEPGRRFWVRVRYQHLYFLRKYGRSAAAEELVVDSALASWAFLSDCKENLYDSILSAEPSWLEMRNIGVGFWFTNTTQLRTKMEKLARSQYLKKKDPKDCALLYLALNRVQVLAGLFKISRDEKDKLLVAFLSRNFQNLLLLFFLLGGDPSSAVTVCAKNLGDEQLALVICRLIQGICGPLEHQLISNFLLPSAMEKGDYWLSSMLECMLGNYSQCMNNLINCQMGPMTSKPPTSANEAVFSDPSIGRYCAILATKNSLKNSIGDYLAITLSKLAMVMVSIALKRCGLPVSSF